MRNILVLAMVFLSLKTQAQKALFYIGSSEKGPNGSITLAELNLANGEISVIDTINSLTSPGFLAISPNKKNLYAVSGDNKINAFSIGGDHRLSYQNSQPSFGDNPCHVSVHPSGKLVFVSNYSGGTFSAYSVAANGSLDQVIFTDQYRGSGPNKKRQDRSHAHYAEATPNGKYVYVTDLGADRIMNYTVSAKSKKIIPNAKQNFFTGTDGAGPRHFIVHPSGKNLILLNELTATVTSCSIDNNGVIKEIATYETAPQDAFGNTSSAIHLHPNGKFVYVSNRGYNAVGAFKILDDGRLEKVGEARQGIEIPRDFNIDPSGKMMVIANQTKDNLVVYNINPETGELTFLHDSINTKKPICITFLDGK